MTILGETITRRQLFTFVSLIFLVISIPLIIYLVRNQQLIKSRAAEGTRIEFIDSNGNILTTTATRNTKLKLSYTLASSSAGAFELIKEANAQTRSISPRPAGSTAPRATLDPRCTKSDTTPTTPIFSGGINPCVIFPTYSTPAFSCPTGTTYGPSGNVIAYSEDSPLDSATCQARYGSGCDCSNDCTSTAESRNRGDVDERYTAFTCHVSCSVAGSSNYSFNIVAKPACSYDGTYQGYVTIKGWPQTSNVIIYRRRAGSNDSFQAVVAQPGSSDARCSNMSVYDSPDAGGFPYEYYTEGGGQSSGVVSVSNFCPKMAMISGRIFIDRNKDGIKNIDEPYFENATVMYGDMAMPANGSNNPTTYHSPGEFRSSDDPPGSRNWSTIPQGHVDLTITLPEGYLVTNPQVLSFELGPEGAFPNIGVLPPPTYPTHFRVANTESSLASAGPQIFSPPSQTIDWILPTGSGLKTVYAQFKVDNIWGPILSATINFVSTDKSPSPTSSDQPIASTNPANTTSPSSSAKASARPGSSAGSTYPSPQNYQTPHTYTTPTGSYSTPQSYTTPGVYSTPGTGQASTNTFDKKFDLNNDGVVNSIDVSVLFAEWKKGSRANLTKVDFNADKTLNSIDYALLRKEI